MDLSGRDFALSVIRCFLLLFFAGSALLAAPSEYYVSTTGSDAAAGTFAAPFLTLEKASGQITTAGVPAGGVTVWIRGGKYFRTAFFQPSRPDPVEKITYRSYPQEIVRLIGGKQLTLFTPVVDSAILARLKAGAQANVVQTTLSAEGVSTYGQLVADGVTHGDVLPRSELYYNGVRMNLAQTPTPGTWSTIASVPTGLTSGGFRYSGDVPASWTTSTNWWVRGFWNNGYEDGVEHISSINTNTRVVLMDTRGGGTSIVSGQPYYIFNVLEELDEAGEYYIDYATGILYFWPPTAIASGEAILSIPFASQPRQGLVYMVNATNITWQGIVFDSCAGYGMNQNGGASNVISGCLFRNSGRIGINCESDANVISAGPTISDCDIEDTGYSAIRAIGIGVRTNLTPGTLVISNCAIKRCGRWITVASRGISAGAGVGESINHNYINDVPEAGIQFDGNNNTVEFNEISNACNVAVDAGALYIGGDWSYQGNVIRYNYLHDFDGQAHDSIALYLDDWASGSTVYGNVFSKTPYSILLGGGRDNLIRNNIFFQGTNGAIWFDARGIYPTATNDLYTTRWDLLNLMPSNTFRSAYPLLTNVDYWYAHFTNGIPPENNTLATNIFFGGTWITTRLNATTNMLTQTSNLTSGDPLFVSSTDFHLQNSSPAFALGFVQIPTEQIGLRNSTARNELAFIKAHTPPGPPPRYAASPTVRAGTVAFP